MINFRYAKSYCNEDISLIENYDTAIADSTQMWDCHHRKEITTSRKDLIKKNEYYNRPASELIFLTQKDHISLHSKGNKNMLGKHHNDETKKKMSIANKNMSEETKHKMSIAKKGLLWFNNGIISVRAKSCPEGFVKGMIKKSVNYKNDVIVS